MNDFLVAETYSYALFNGIFFTRWVETTALITAFLFTLLSQGMWRRLSSCHGKQIHIAFHELRYRDSMLKSFPKNGSP